VSGVFELVDYDEHGDVVPLTGSGRAALREVGDRLLELAAAVEPAEAAQLTYLAGRLHGLAGRVPTELESPN
jgi:hypothetical protein